MGMRPTEPTLPKPAALKKAPFVTEAELAKLLKVSKDTVRAWRRRGETPSPANDEAALAFAETRRKSVSRPMVYRCSEVSAWVFGDAGPGGRPKELPASAYDPENDRTMHLRRAAQAAKAAGDAVLEKRIRRKLTDQAKLAARLGFKGPDDYEAWIARGSPEDELPPECRVAEAMLTDDPSIEHLSQRTDAAIAKMRGISPSVVTAERHRAEPRPPDPPVVPSYSWPAPYCSPWQAADELVEPFPTAGRAAPRRSPGGYFRGGF